MLQTATLVVYSCQLCIFHAYRKEISISPEALRLAHSDVYLRSSLTLVSSSGNPNVYLSAYLVTDVTNSTLRILRRVNVAYDSNFNFDELTNYSVNGLPNFNNTVLGLDHLIVAETNIVRSYTRDSRCTHRQRNRSSLTNRLPPSILEPGPLVVNPHAFVSSTLMHAPETLYAYNHSTRTRFELELQPQNANTIVPMLFPDLRQMTFTGRHDVQLISDLTPLRSIRIPQHRSILPCLSVEQTSDEPNVSVRTLPDLTMHDNMSNTPRKQYFSRSTQTNMRDPQSPESLSINTDVFNSLFGPYDLSISDHVFGFLLNYAETGPAHQISILTISQRLHSNATVMTNQTTGLIPRNPSPDPSTLYDHYESPSPNAFVEFLLRLHSYLPPRLILEGSPHECLIPVRCPLSDIVNNRIDISIRQFFIPLVEDYVNTVLNVKQTPLAIFGLLSELRCQRMPSYIRTHLASCQPRQT